MNDLTDTLQAVLGRAKPASGVAARDFKKPRRLGQEHLREITLRVENLLPQLEKRLVQVAGLRVDLALAGLDEYDADAIFAGAAEPPCALRFRSEKDPSWLVWDSTAAVAVLETIFGAKASAGTARPLSPTEAKVASQFLAEIVRSVASVLEVTVSDFTLVQVASELGTWREGGEGAEPHRLLVRLALQRADQSSELRLFFPRVSPADTGALEQLPAALPAHLEHVEVELSARLSGCEISLDQLLALEEGDVIPLDAHLGDPTRLCVEGLTLAEARLGSHRGRLAVRIERLNVQAEAAA